MTRKPGVAPADEPAIARASIDEATVMNSDSYMRVFLGDGPAEMGATTQTDGGAAQPGCVGQGGNGAAGGSGADVTGRDCVQLILRAVLGMPDLVVESHQVGVDLSGAVSRDAWLDVLARDAQGRHFDVELQCDPSRGRPRRARFYAAKLDVATVASGADPQAMADAWVVFVTDGGVEGVTSPLDDYVRTGSGSGLPLGDGSHIVYANARELAEGQGELADVMHDLLCADPDEMHNTIMAQRTRQVKASGAKGADMRKFEDIIYEQGMERGIEQGVEKTSRESARRMAAKGFARDVIAEILGLSEEALAKLLESDPAPAAAQPA